MQTALVCLCIIRLGVCLCVTGKGSRAPGFKRICGDALAKQHSTIIQQQRRLLLSCCAFAQRGVAAVHPSGALTLSLWKQQGVPQTSPPAASTVNGGPPGCSAAPFPNTLLLPGLHLPSGLAWPGVVQ